MARRSSSPTTVTAATGCASSSRSFPRYCPPAPAELDAALAARSRGSARPTASPSRSSAGSRTAALGCTAAGAFPYMSWRDIDVGDVPVRALRVTYVGELGWELYCPTEFGTALWRTVWSAGAEHGLVAGGYRAIDSLRLERGYRVWGADITPDEHPFQAGLGFAVKLDKGEFIGREALVRAREEGTAPSLCCLVLADPRAVALSNEPVQIDGQVLGRVTSGGYGYTVGKSIAYAYLPPEHATPGTEVAVEIFGEWVTGEVVAEPLHDPQGE